MVKDLSAEKCSILTVEETAAEFSCLLDFAYSLGGCDINADNIRQCLDLSSYHDVPRLANACDTYMSVLTLEPAALPTWIQIASQYPQCGVILAHCETYAAENLQNIISARCAVCLWPFLSLSGSLQTKAK